MTNDKLILPRTVDADVEKHLDAAKALKKLFSDKNRSDAPAYFIRTLGCQQN